MSDQDKPYNPLDYDNLTVNLVRELMSRPAIDLPPKKSFNGPGVYALFYNGPLVCYGPCCSPKSDVPIYVGKAVPPGARKGGFAGAESEKSPALYKRLREHADSIEFAQNLKLEHFKCRYLVVVRLWITMAERFLIEQYKPIWNVCLEGFGLHDPGKGRHQGEISWWDALHPGRPWAQRLQQTRDQDVAKKLLREYLAGKIAPKEPAPENEE